MNTLTGHTQAVSHKGQVTGRGNSEESQNRDENRQPLTPYKAMIRWDRMIPGLPKHFFLKAHFKDIGKAIAPSNKITQKITIKMP